MADPETFPCQICGEHKKENEIVPAAQVRESIVDFIVKEHPSWAPEGYICHEDLGRFRIAYVRDVLEKENDECASFKDMDHTGVNEEDHLPKNDYAEYERELTFGEHISDKIAGFARQLVFYCGVCRPDLPVGRPEHLCFTLPAVRPVSFHPAESGPFGPYRSPGPRHYHEPEPAGDSGPPACRS